MKKPKLVSNWKRSWRWFSVQAMALQGTAATVWAVNPDDVRATFPSEYVAGFFIVVSVLALIGRLISQDEPA